MDYCVHHEVMPNLSLKAQEYGVECASNGGACSPREFLLKYFPGKETLPVLDFLKYVRAVSKQPSLFEIVVLAGTESIIEGMCRGRREKQ